jgi:cytochrome c553
MSADEYRELAYGRGAIVGGEAADVTAARDDCLRCHADNGRGQDDVPVLAAQKAAYLAAALDDYAAGRRDSAVMSAAAARVSPEVRQALAESFAREPGGLLSSEPRPASDSSPLAQRAADVAANGLPELDVPACVQCHAPGKRERYPILARQKSAYLAQRLRSWRGDADVVEARKERRTMPMIARRIPEELLVPLAEHFAAQ